MQIGEKAKISSISQTVQHKSSFTSVTLLSAVHVHLAKLSQAFYQLG